MRRVPWGRFGGPTELLLDQNQCEALRTSHLLVTLNNFERIARPSLIACAPATYLLNVRPIKFRW